MVREIDDGGYELRRRSGVRSGGEEGGSGAAGLRVDGARDEGGRGELGEAAPATTSFGGSRQWPGGRNLAATARTRGERAGRERELKGGVSQGLDRGFYRAREGAEGAPAGGMAINGHCGRPA